jgi:hypothetical protein
MRNMDVRLAGIRPVSLHDRILGTHRLVGPSPLVDPGLAQTAREAVDLLSYCLRDSPKNYWVEVSSDLDLLFGMLEVADSGGDWKGYLADQRAEPE